MKGVDGKELNNDAKTTSRKASPTLKKIIWRETDKRVYQGSRRSKEIK